MKTKTSTNHKLTEQFVSDKVVDWLYDNGWKHGLRRGALYQHGVDIRVQNSQPPHTQYFYIEVKGASSAKYANAVDDGSVITSIGQIMTRMDHGFKSNHYAIAIPETSMKTVTNRLPWQIAKMLFLSVFSVSKKGIVTRYKWKELRELQHKK